MQPDCLIDGALFARSGAVYLVLLRRTSHRTDRAMTGGQPEWSSAGVEIAAECFSDDVGGRDPVLFGARCDLFIELGVEAD